VARELGVREGVPRFLVTSTLAIAEREGREGTRGGRGENVWAWREGSGGVGVGVAEGGRKVGGSPPSVITQGQGPHHREAWVCEPRKRGWAR